MMGAGTSGGKTSGAGISDSGAAGAGTDGRERSDAASEEGATAPGGIDLIDESVRRCDLVKSGTCDKSLRVCCYGSSSSSTPEPYIKESRNLGYILAKRGHTCVNGAGSCGCMAAMNDGAAAGNGHIIGVIHEMWLRFPSDGEGKEGGTSSKGWTTPSTEGSSIVQSKPKVIREGGAHSVFKRSASLRKGNSSDDGDRGDKSVERKQVNRDGPIREILVAGGKDLQERKRLLVENADALVVLPGGTGTWDELWEMACARNLGLSDLPIVCVNINGYYDPFMQMLERAWEDKLIKREPNKVVRFEATAIDAVRYIESLLVHGPAPDPVALGQKSSDRSHPPSSSSPSTSGDGTSGGPSKSTLTKTLRKSSFISSPVVLGRYWSLSSFDEGDGDDDANGGWRSILAPRSGLMGTAIVFLTGVSMGFLLADRQRRQQNIR